MLERNDRGYNMEQVKVTEHISYIQSSTEPLSAEVGIIEGEQYFYLFDVGNNNAVSEYLETLSKPKKIILSHFHPDHMGNIGKVSFEMVFAGVNTEKYFRNYILDYATERMAELTGALSNVLEGTVIERKKSRYEIVLEPIYMEDGVKLEIYPMPNSHAKGSLALMVNDRYLFMGDAFYSKVKDGNYVYNAQLLKEEIELLKRLPAEFVISSHAIPPIREKKAELSILEEIYAKRQKEEAYIYISI